MSFLPDDYEVPDNGGGNYLKFKPGDTRFRILDDPILGQVYFNNDNKPVRKRMGEQIDMDDVKVDQYGKKRVRHFWAMPVFNPDVDAVQILEITQSTIQDKIVSLNKNPDWGDPKQYGLTVTRSGEGKDTKYEVIAAPPRPLPDGVLQRFEEKRPNMEALFTNEDPFAGEPATSGASSGGSGGADDKDDIPF